jgi:hypothetical protein
MLALHPSRLAIVLSLALSACGGLVVVEDTRPAPRPQLVDSDRDGLYDDEERQYGTLVYDPDSDRDGIYDGEEVLVYYTDPLSDDSDVDELYDGEEIYDTYTDPLLWDTDADGLSDGDEVFTHLSDPNVWDTDDDGRSDGREVTSGTDPLVAYH